MPQWTTRWMMSWWNCQGHWQVAMWHYFWILLDFMRAPRWIGKKVPWSRFDKCGKKLWKGGLFGSGSALVSNFQRIETFDIDFVIGYFWYFWKLEHVRCIDHDFPFFVTSGLEAKDHSVGSVLPFHERLTFQMLQFPQFSWDHIHKLLGTRGPAFPTFSFFLFIEIIYVDHKMIE